MAQRTIKIELRYDIDDDKREIIYKLSRKAAAQLCAGASLVSRGCKVAMFDEDYFEGSTDIMKEEEVDETA